MTHQDSQLVEEIFKISRFMRDNMSFHKHLTHLSILQFQTLIYIKKNNNAQMSEIAQEFNIELPSATSLINKLCKTKLVARKADKKDRRLVRISLTKKGTVLLETALHERSKKIQENLAYLSKKDKYDLLRIIQKMSSKLDSKHEK